MSENKNIKLVPMEKLSKKEKKKINAKARRGWNGIKPTIRTVESKKIYKKSKFKHNIDC